MLRYPAPLARLIEIFRKLPGVGVKSAERFAFHLLSEPETVSHEVITAILQAREHLHNCPVCGCLIGKKICDYCNTKNRDSLQLCIVAHAKDVFIIDSTGEYQGLYHVLGGLLSPMKGYHPEDLFLNNLKDRIQLLNIQEVVIALDSTLEGDATAWYLKRELAACKVKLSRLAFGLPIGSSFEFVDSGTLARAFMGRGQF
ncbi:MAG: recombination protein RecR [Chlamydiales bacterium]|jgi:recombination protein RecR|nr:recombination protein RecR [Chlamydiales bacterium]